MFNIYFKPLCPKMTQSLVITEQKSFSKSFFLNKKGCFYSGKREENTEKYTSK